MGSKQLSKRIYARKLIREGRGSALQGQSDWEKPLVGVLKSVR